MNTENPHNRELKGEILDGIESLFFLGFLAEISRDFNNSRLVSGTFFFVLEARFWATMCLSC